MLNLLSYAFTYRKYWLALICFSIGFSGAWYIKAKIDDVEAQKATIQRQQQQIDNLTRQHANDAIIIAGNERQERFTNENLAARESEVDKWRAKSEQIDKSANAEQKLINDTNIITDSFLRNIYAEYGTTDLPNVSTTTSAVSAKLQRYDAADTEKVLRQQLDTQHKKLIDCQAMYDYIVYTIDAHNHTVQLINGGK